MNRYELSTRVDTIIAKSLGLSEVAQVAKTEARLVKFMISEWSTLVDKAVDLAFRKAQAGANSEEVVASVDRIMKRWAKIVRKIYRDEMRRSYELSRQAAWKKAIGRTANSLQYSEEQSPSLVQKAAPLEGFDKEVEMDETDAEMAALLSAMGVQWVDDHYDMNVQDAVRNIVRDKLAAEGVIGPEFRDSLTKALMTLAVVGGFAGPIQNYIEGLVANSFATIRMGGHLRSFMDVGVTHYTINVTADERTCTRCLWMDGKTFTVEDGARALGNIMTSETLGELKSAQPWLNMSQIKQVSTGPGVQRGTAALRDRQGLSDANFILPPFHFRCRCTVDVATERNVIEDLVPIAFTVGFANVLRKE